MTLNADSVFLGMKEAIPKMRTQGGSIINISSIMEIVGGSGVSSYSAAKGAVRLLTKSVAVECGKRGLNVRVNSIHPGFVQTPAFDVGVRHQPGSNDVIRELTSGHPIGRLGRSVEIAEAVCFLASDASSFVTGAELVVDGGYTAQ